MFDWNGDGNTDDYDYLYYRDFVCDDNHEEDSDDDEDDEDDGGDDTADWQGSGNYSSVGTGYPVSGGSSKATKSYYQGNNHGNDEMSTGRLVACVIGIIICVINPLLGIIYGAFICSFW